MTNNNNKDKDLLIPEKHFHGPHDEALGSPAPLRRSGGSQPTSAFHSTRHNTFNDWYDGTESGDYAEIRARSTDFDERGKRREYSAPLSPKTVKFEDEIEKTYGPGPVSPSGLYSKPDKYRFQPINAHSNAPQPNLPPQQRIGAMGTKQPSLPPAFPSRGPPTAPSSHQHINGTSVTNGTNDLDEATLDLLRLSTEPTVVTYSTNPRISPNADKLQKAASTNSMHKVIRTQDGGTVKLANTFTWDVDRLRQDHSLPPLNGSPRTTQTTSTIKSRNADGTETSSTRNEATHEETIRRPGPPIIRTTVEGKMKIEKSVGAKLLTIDHQICKAYTIRDVTTHYKIKTSMGKRSLLIEERPGSGMASDTNTGVRTSGTYRLSVFEDGKEIGSQEANIGIPENMSKPDYLANLSKKLLADIASLDGDQITAMTRVEIERIEDVQDIVKTYMIGQAAPLSPEPTPMPLPTVQEYAYETASDHLSSVETPDHLQAKIYVDTLEQEKELELAKKDYHLTNEGNRFEDTTRIGPRIRRIESDTESVDSIVAKRREPRCANVFAECDLKRTEDQSLNEVFIAEPLWSSASMIMRKTVHRKKPKTPPLANYGLEQEGQRFKDATTLKTEKKFESDEEQEIVKVQQQQKVESNQEALAAEYDLELQGQRLEGSTKIRKTNKFDSESDKSSIAPEELEPPPASYDMERAGQNLEGKSRIRRHNKFDSESSNENVEEEGVKQRGGITHVTLIKKESNGKFEVTIECARIGEPTTFKIREKPQLKFENLEFMKTIEKEDDEEEETSAKKSFKTQRIETAKTRVREMSEENAMVMYSLECEVPRKAEMQHVQRGKSVARAEMTSEEISQETASTQVYLKNEKESESKTQKSVKTVREEKIQKSCSEVSIKQETCSVMMENRGNIVERAKSEWAKPVTVKQWLFN
uniref:Uncharacterized protein n=1 Tax=Panagrolaimus davidi TaxID=227884 RepID=A0A914Q014_9BILA